MIRILIVTDHVLLLQGVKSLLKNEPCIKAIAASSSDELFKELNSQSISVVIVDVRMFSSAPHDIFKILKTNYPQIKIIALNTVNHRDYLKDKPIAVNVLLNAAADFYDLVHNIYNITGRKFHIAEFPRETSCYPKDISLKRDWYLTKREIEVISLIRKGLTSRKIAEKLFISLNTVKQHRKHIMCKLDIKNLHGLMEFAIERNM